MRKALIVAAALVASSTVGAQQQPQTQFLISTRILAGSPQDGSSMKVVAAPVFRVRAGQAGTLNLEDASNGLTLSVTPSELSEGRVALHVVAGVRHGARAQGATFDVLTGPTVATATVALRDATGAFLLDDRGFPMFVEFTSVVPIVR